MKTLAQLRQAYHRKLSQQIAFRTASGETSYANFADGNSRTSVEIADNLSQELGFSAEIRKISGQTAGNLFEKRTCGFLTDAFQEIQHLRPGKWEFRTSRTAISNFVQYHHLDEIAQLVVGNQELSAALGHGYIVTPDIVVIREPIDDEEINQLSKVIRPRDRVAKLTQLRAANQNTKRGFLHASISCKWTIRSDRSQNTRTEALNLVRNRKGTLPHVVAVTAEPLPMRIASLALGTGDLDCVYHFALPELRNACAAVDRGEDQLEMLDTMIEGMRLRDISDLPFDLAV